MAESIPRENSLVLYRTHAARVVRAEDKLTLELIGGEIAKVRPKDVVLLHPGPCKSLAELTPQGGDAQTAWEILAGGESSLADVAELAFGSFTPATAWAAWQLVADGVHFRGTPDRVSAATPDEVLRVMAARAAEALEKRAWEGFLERAREGKVGSEDSRYLREVEDLALARTERSRVMKALGREESPENAHAFLLECGYWDDRVNPYPARQGVNLTAPTLSLPDEWRDLPAALRREERLDLTGLPAYAIDDAWTDTPDDALSLDPATGRLWVHIADAAALIAPDSPLDLDARDRGASLYLPEGVTPMLPHAAIPLLGLGLAEVSPALSFRLEINAEGRLGGIEIAPTLVRVHRLTYETVAERLAEEPFRTLHELAERCEARRTQDGALRIELPEADVRVRDGEVTVTSIPPLRSRALVENAMILAGEAAALFGQAHDIPLPYATQDAPEGAERRAGSGGQAATGPGLAGQYTLRRTFKRSQYRGAPGAHSGLGLPAYAQATSPLRRYLDLVVHQQLRAFLAGRPLLTAQQILERVGQVEAALPALRQAERQSDQHWKLVYLRRNPGWRGTGVLVEQRGRSSMILIPALALETEMHLAADLALNSELSINLRSVDLPRLDARFKLETNP